MTRTWFTQYDGPWDPNEVRKHFTKGPPDDHHSYANIISDLRNWFFLEKTPKVGYERGTGIPKIYTPPSIAPQKIQVFVDEFKWGDFTKVDGVWQPLLQLKIRVFQSPNTTTRQRGARLEAPKLIMDYWVEIRFDPQWPYKPPHVRIDDDRYTSFDGDMHANHMFENGWVCFFAGDDDWHSDTDTIISFVQAFFDWLMFHYKKFGW